MTTLDELPVDAIGEILKFLPRQDWKKVRLTSKSLSESVDIYYGNLKKRFKKETTKGSTKEFDKWEKDRKEQQRIVDYLTKALTDTRVDLQKWEKKIKRYKLFKVVIPDYNKWVQDEGTCLAKVESLEKRLKLAQKKLMTDKVIDRALIQLYSDMSKDAKIIHQKVDMILTDRDTLLNKLKKIDELLKKKDNKDES